MKTVSRLTDLDDWASETPDFDASRDQQVANIVEELTTKLLEGEAIDLEAAVQAHPEYEKDLRELWPMMCALVSSSQSCVNSRKPIPDLPSDIPVSILGDFQLVREVGRGGMGIVFEARQVSLNRVVAVKVLPFASAMDPRRLQRFQNETQAVAHLHHKNIVPIHAVGCDQGIHYFAM